MIDWVFECQDEGTLVAEDGESNRCGGAVDNPVLNICIAGFRPQ